MPDLREHRPGHPHSPDHVPATAAIAMTMRRRSRRLGEARILAGLERGLTQVTPANLLVVIWRWRYELGLLAGLPVGVVSLIRADGWRWALFEIGLLALTVCTWPEIRYWITAHTRCVVTAHRLRTGCAQAWIHTRHGKLPILLRTRPRPFGEQAHLWCRAGTSFEDFEFARDLLRAACWAHDVRVTRSPRYSHIVILDVIRQECPG
jgi:hypothetical protein